MHIGYGVAYANIKNYSLAIADFEKAISLTSDEDLKAKYEAGKTAIATAGYEPQPCVYYREECPTCGAIFVIDQVEDKPYFRIHVQITNTGELGKLTFTLDRSSVRLFNPDQAATYKAEFEEAQSQGMVAALLGRIAPQTITIIRPRSEVSLDEGQRWNGSFLSLTPLPADAVGMVLQLAPFTADKPGPSAWSSYAEGHPLIEIKR